MNGKMMIAAVAGAGGERWKRLSEFLFDNPYIYDHLIIVFCFHAQAGTAGKAAATRCRISAAEPAGLAGGPGGAMPRRFRDVRRNARPQRARRRPEPQGTAEGEPHCRADGGRASAGGAGSASAPRPVRMEPSPPAASLAASALTAAHESG